VWWADPLREGRRRGMRAPVLAIGDGALGFWAALREVFPRTREQRDWVHKAMNVLDALPTSAQPAARKALAEIRDAEDREHAEAAVRSFAELFGAKYPKVVAKVVDDAEALLAFYDFPAEHWVHLKTSNPIWVFDSAGQPGRCFPGWCSSWPALTLNPIDAVRLSWTRSVGPAA
jgi:putative transposase